MSGRLSVRMIDDNKEKVFVFIYLAIYSFFFYFFFQAEDGIRDWSVTGVQTCALPI